MDREKLLAEIRGGVRLRPTKTVDKSGPIINAEGEGGVKVSQRPITAPEVAPTPPPPPQMPIAPPPQPQPHIAAQERPPPPKPRPATKPLPPKLQALGSGGGQFDRDKLMAEIRQGVRLRRTVTNDKSQADFSDLLSPVVSNSGGLEPNDSGYVSPNHTSMNASPVYPGAESGEDCPNFNQHCTNGTECPQPKMSFQQPLTVEPQFIVKPVSAPQSNQTMNGYGKYSPPQQTSPQYSQPYKNVAPPTAPPPPPPLTIIPPPPPMILATSGGIHRAKPTPQFASLSPVVQTETDAVFAPAVSEPATSPKVSPTVPSLPTSQPPALESVMQQPIHGSVKTAPIEHAAFRHQTELYHEPTFNRSQPVPVQHPSINGYQREHSETPSFGSADQSNSGYATPKDEIAPQRNASVYGAIPFKTHTGGVTREAPRERSASTSSAADGQPKIPLEPGQLKTSMVKQIFEQNRRTNGYKEDRAGADRRRSESIPRAESGVSKLKNMYEKNALPNQPAARIVKVLDDRITRRGSVQNSNQFRTFTQTSVERKTSCDQPSVDVAQQNFTEPKRPSFSGSEADGIYEAKLVMPSIQQRIQSFKARQSLDQQLPRKMSNQRDLAPEPTPLGQNYTRESSEYESSSSLESPDYGDGFMQGPMLTYDPENFDDSQTLTNANGNYAYDTNSEWDDGDGHYFVKSSAMRQTTSGDFDELPVDHLPHMIQFAINLDDPNSMLRIVPRH